MSRSGLWISLLAAALPLACVQLPTLDDLILHPSLNMKQVPTDLGYQYQEVALPVGQTRSVVIWHVFAEKPKAVVLVLPGADGNKGRYLEALPILVPNGYDVILMDYEGFGTSPGAATLGHLVDDAFAASAYALGQHKKVFVFGPSLGAPLAARVAADLPFTGCILEGTVILNEEAKLWLVDNNLPIPFLWNLANLFICLQTPEDYDTLKYIRLVDEPKLVMHSTEDEVAPYEGALRVFAAAPPPKDFWEMRGGHGQMIRLQTDLYTSKLVGWLNLHTGHADEPVTLPQQDAALPVPGNP